MSASMSNKLLYTLVFTIIIIGLMFAYSSAAASADEYDTLRERYDHMLTGGTGYDTQDSNIATLISNITSEAQGYWDTMQTANPRSFIWSDLASASSSANIYWSYSRLEVMARAYRTYGSGLEGNTTLRDDIINALDWLYTNRYNESSSQFGNWYHWEIGIPMELNDITVLLYDELTSTQVNNYMNAIFHQTPSVDMTGFNRIAKASVVAVSGIISKNSTKIANARNGLSPVLNYVTSGDGFYEDGSFIQHGKHPYNGGYGVGGFLLTSNVMYLLSDSTWEVTDPNKDHIFEWAYNAYEPLIFNGSIMPSVIGRNIAAYTTNDHLAAHSAMTAILRLSQFAPATDADAFKAMVKHWLQTDTYSSYLENTAVSIELIQYSNDILNDSNIIPRALSIYKQYLSMDRVVQKRPDYAFGVSMHSSRIYNYESLNIMNTRGWLSANGMTYLFNSDLSQYSDVYWPTVDQYRYAGITSLRNISIPPDKTSDQSWVGGTNILDLYGVTGMQLHPYGQNLYAKKSWFMFDDEIVALGADINSTDHVEVDTVVENRRINSSGDNVLTVDGTTKSTSLSWQETMTDVNWIHLEGNVPGSDIGYYYPGGTTDVVGKREARTNSWDDIDNRRDSATPTTDYTRNYLSLWIEHGVNPTDSTYSYVLLPGKTSPQVSSYAASPDVLILENSGEAQAVKETNLNIIGVNFWKDETKTVDIITSNKKAAVMTRETANDIEVSVADPTQLNTGHISIEINKAASSVIVSDSRVIVTQLNPTIKFSVNVNGASGKAFKVKFELGEELIIDDGDSGFTRSGFGSYYTDKPTSYNNDVRFDFTFGAGDYARYTPNVTGEYAIYVMWGNYTNKATDAPYTVRHTGGDTTIDFDQNNTPGWHYHGTYMLDGTSYVEISGSADGHVVADAVKFVPIPAQIVIDNDESGFTRSGFGSYYTDLPTSYNGDMRFDYTFGAGDFARYTPNLTGIYNVYVMWGDYTSKATDTPYTVRHTGGYTTIDFNQNNTPGWHYHGTYMLDGNSYVEISGEADGPVVADAVKFEQAYN